MAISDNAFQADQNENMDIVEVDVDPFASAAVDPSDNDEFETNVDDGEDDEFTSSSDSGSEDEFEDGGNPEDEDVEDINRHPEETSTTGRGSLLHHATPAHPDGHYSLHYTHRWSHVTRPYLTYAPGPSSSHYTSSSLPSHPYPYQHGTSCPPVHALPPQHGFIPSSSHHSTPSPTADVYPHDHGIRSSSSRHATPSSSGHPTHSPGVGDEHTSTSRRSPTPHRHSSARSSSSRLRSSIPHVIEEIPDFFRPPTAPAEGENPLIYLIGEHGLGSKLISRTSVRLHELEELQRDHQRLQETLQKERMERQEQMQRDKMEYQEETRDMQDWLACMEALLMQHLGIRPHVPPTPQTPPSPVTKRYGPQSDDHPGHLTAEIAPSQSAHPHDHRHGHWTSPHIRMSEDQRHLLDDHDEFMEQLMPPPRPPPRQKYVQRVIRRDERMSLGSYLHDRCILTGCCPQMENQKCFKAAF
ncbi:hypothetical protein Syun_014333 [Stephania yunnanensis]|uniref:Uncharacterized protein n=1 Tax=Stephania yunnanensis TaxID=152371 RepID=A0AAP0JKU0_9MAGN